MTSSGCKALPPPIIRTTSRPSRRNPSAQGDAAKGKKIFQLPALELRGLPRGGRDRRCPRTCQGAQPPALAAGLPTDLIVESVLWPARQIKEGYETVTITTKDGRIHSGFLQAADRRAVSRLLILPVGKSWSCRQEISPAVPRPRPSCLRA